jgi:hypothetical protein
MGASLSVAAGVHHRAVRSGQSPEQHREESNRLLGVEGVQKVEVTRIVGSGKN